MLNIFCSLDPITSVLEATVGKLCLFPLPLKWQEILRSSNAGIVFSMPIKWLSYDSYLSKIVGVPLPGNSMSFNALLMSLNGTERRLSSLSLSITVRSKPYLANPPYVVESNISTSLTFTRFRHLASSSALSHFCSIFLLKLSKLLPHVEPTDVTIVSARLDRRSSAKMNRSRFITFTVCWFVEKFSFQVFEQHYLPVLINSKSKAPSKEFFFALLPELVLESVKIFSPNSEFESTVADQDNNGVSNSILHLPIFVPILVVACCVLVCVLLLVIRQRKRNARFGRKALIDKTYSKRR